MWFIKDSPALLTDLYELTMAQAYFGDVVTGRGCFEVTVRTLPANWGFFVMAGLAELRAYLEQFKFSDEDLAFLESTELFSSDFVGHLGRLRPDVQIRALPEGTVFFPHEPVLELSGPLIDAQIIESYVLNILGFSIIEATLATRISIAAKGVAVVDFGLRRTQGPVASVRAARGAQMAGFSATSNVFAARALGFASAGTMAHSFIQVHENEEQAFRRFAELYGERTVLLVDTFDSIKGIDKAAEVARQIYEEKGVKIKGIRLDSGDFVRLSKYARRHFKEEGVEFLKIFVSSALDEYRIAEMLEAGAEVDGFGIGTRFAVSHGAPDLDIVYKIIQYGDKGLFKSSPDKQTKAGRKSNLRSKDGLYVKDTVVPFSSGADDLVQPFEDVEPMEAIGQRLACELANLPEPVKAIKNPQPYVVEFAC
jgi:nicotinate phosphoribosyltransferase